MKEFIVSSLGDMLEVATDEKIITQYLKKFSCTRKSEIENFLHNDAINHEKSDSSRTYLILDKEQLDNHGDIEVMAYYTFGIKILNVSSLNNSQKGKIFGKLHSKDKVTIPSYVIGKLARNDKYNNKDISGSTIIDLCLYQLNLVKKIVGGRVAMVDCKQPLVKFYEKNGFTLVSKQPAIR